MSKTSRRAAGSRADGASRVGSVARHVLPLAAILLISSSVAHQFDPEIPPPGFVADPLGQAILTAFSEPSDACPAGHYRPPGGTRCVLCLGYAYEHNIAHIRAVGPWFAVAPGTFAQVAARCVAQGGVLASVHSDAEAAIVGAKCPALPCYIGLSRPNGTDPYTWVDGSPLNYTAWDTTQPQNYQTVTVITTWAGKAWHDYATGEQAFWGVCRTDTLPSGERSSIDHSFVCSAGTWLRDQCASGDTRVDNTCEPCTGTPKQATSETKWAYTHAAGPSDSCGIKCDAGLTFTTHAVLGSSCGFCRDLYYTGTIVSWDGVSSTLFYRWTGIGVSTDTGSAYDAFCGPYLEFPEGPTYFTYCQTPMVCDTFVNGICTTSSQLCGINTAGTTVSDCTNEHDYQCVDCFGYCGGVACDPQTCPPGYFLWDKCGHGAPQVAASRCVACSNWKPTHAYYLNPPIGAFSQDACSWECYPGFRSNGKSGWEEECQYCGEEDLDCLLPVVTLDAVSSAADFFGVGLAFSDKNASPAHSIWSQALAAVAQLDGRASAESVRFAASFSAPAGWNETVSGTLRGVLHVAADSKGMVFLNGVKVGGVDARVEGPYPYAWGEMRTAPAYAAIPVELKPGSNFLNVYVDNLRKERAPGEGAPQLLCLLVDSAGLVVMQTDAAWRWSDGGTGPGSLIAVDHVAVPYGFAYP